MSCLRRRNHVSIPRFPREPYPDFTVAPPEPANVMGENMKNARQLADRFWLLEAIRERRSAGIHTGKCDEEQIETIMKQEDGPPRV